MARPRKVTPDRVAQVIQEIIQEYEESNDIFRLTDYSVMQRLGISRRTLDRYYDGEADKALLEDNNISAEERERYTKCGYGDAIKTLIEYRSAVCLREMTTGRNIPAWIFASKQGRWGGWQDVQRVESQGKQTVTVCISGPDGKPLKE
jgi:AraC-like DNA-binding protein